MPYAPTSTSPNLTDYPYMVNVRRWYAENTNIPPVLLAEIGDATKLRSYLLRTLSGVFPIKTMNNKLPKDMAGLDRKVAAAIDRGYISYTTHPELFNHDQQHH